jgi:hypothetical protein
MDAREGRDVALLNSDTLDWMARSWRVVVKELEETKALN